MVILTSSVSVELVLSFWPAVFFFQSCVATLTTRVFSQSCIAILTARVLFQACIRIFIFILINVMPFNQYQFHRPFFGSASTMILTSTVQTSLNTSCTGSKQLRGRTSLPRTLCYRFDVCDQLSIMHRRLVPSLVGDQTLDPIKYRQIVGIMLSQRLGRCTNIKPTMCHACHVCKP